MATVLLPACDALVHPAAQTFSDDDWLSLNSVAGINDTVQAMAVDAAGNLYAGGYFTEIGGVAANRIAKWDGNTWSPLGAGVGDSAGSTTDRVQAIAISGANVFAGGTFLTAGGQESWHLARWSGSEWTGFGRVVSVVTALLTDQDSLYVASGFNFGNGPTGSTVYRWDGLSWYSVGAVDEFKGGVQAMVKSGDALYVGGSSLGANGVDLGNIARWDGDTWTPLGAGTDDRVHALAVLGSDLYVGGWFVRAGGTGVANLMNRIARWDGTSWNQLRTPSSIGLGNQVYSLAVIGDDLFVAGAFSTAGGTPAAGIARWNGTAWSPLGSGVGNLPNTLSAFGNKLYVGGTFATAGGRTSPRIALAYVQGIPAAEILPGSGFVRVFFRDLPPGDYHVQRRGSLDASDAWQSIATRTVDASGALDFVDEDPPPGEAYYQAASLSL